MKEFIFPTNVIPDASFALTECETYCGRIEKCWGCSAHMNNGSYQWNAITQCKDLDEWEGLIQGDVTQRPSRTNKIIFS